MAEEQMGLWRAFWRLLTFYGLRKQLGLVRAADRMFTGSTEGIADAFDLQRDQLVRRYNDLFDAFGQLETVLEEKRLESEALARELRELAVKRDGALTMYERAEQAGDLLQGGEKLYRLARLICEHVQLPDLQQTQRMHCTELLQRPRPARVVERTGHFSVPPLHERVDREISLMCTGGRIGGKPCDLLQCPVTQSF